MAEHQNTGTDNIQEEAPSHLLLVRLWPQESEDGHQDWSGKVQHLVTGETQHFSGWPALIETLLDIMADAQKQSSSFTHSQPLKGRRQ